MADHLIAIGALVLIFTISTFTSVHMGALALVAAFAVGSSVAGENADDVFGGFPGDLFVILVGVTFLFAIAKNNGTIEWLVHAATRAVRGRIALIPWVMFLITAALTAVGAVVPAAVGVIAPIGMSFCVRYGISPLLMGLLVINGASAGGFSPASVFGSITNGVVERNDLPGNPGLLFLMSFLFNVALSVVAYFLFGGRSLLGRRAEDGGGGAAGTGGALATESAGGGGSVPVAPAGTAPAPGGTTTVAFAPATTDVGPRLDRSRALTLIGLLGMIAGALFLDYNVGLMAFTVVVVLTLVDADAAKGAVDRCAWSTVLLVCGVVTFVGVMERMGTINWLGDSVAKIDSPLIGALLICLIGAVVSAFASTTGILGALIPLAVPFLMDGQVGAVGLIIALAVSSSVVDSSPLSTSGALVTANAPEEQRPQVFSGLMKWGMSMAVIAPVATWALFVVPGQG
ncbi:DeoR family transcriptional regulator [Streptomyces alboflavus]|uniref:DeoR family transcriptional regulator n=1 Tax=Streptomyces alboflavus TaxID=67267 RepID=A0A1Z1W5I9_9ACTN|nr:SLC13 family permease [Streptomyces alboflavus]ARX81691.1 DeoR family transcriptional regulator [Streptomyces alboflavus]